jgi:hypothetical protein
MRKKPTYKTGLSKAREEKASQDRLKKRRGVKDGNVVVVEKSHFLKFTVNLTIALFKFVATSILLLLAAIGAIALLYDGVRPELLNVLDEIRKQVIDLQGK